MPLKSKYRPPIIVRGAIAWLPAKRFIKGGIRHLPDEVFDHPVLIFDIPEAGKVDVFLVTSFHTGESLVGRFQTDPGFRSRQIPLNPAPTHPDNGVLLNLADGRVWPKESYISLSLFRIPSRALRDETRGPWALRPESLSALDDLVARLPGLPTWGKSSRSEEDPQRDALKHEAEDEAMEEEEGWTIVVAKKQPTTSLNSSKD
ncbi:hypothetical protein C8A00DRAFT_37400 [Chaetomidium leptoderma]|uniref:Uncharacterized protein n=1 Tax=Chaetomidium leptoderma TaxID=669021 RepID=A0AAN6VES2_9PEZI|nr:hypothetical protein C8A00DRAFT_37400 [Chaetomidium leptoderma]